MIRCLPTILFVGIGLAATRGQTDLSDQIRTAQASGDYAHAAELYKELIADGTDTPEVRSNCGVMLHLAGHEQEALQQFKIALRRKPGLASANLFAGLAELNLHEDTLALGYLEAAANLDPNRPAPQLALGDAHLSLRQYDAANKCYHKASELDSHAAEAWFGIGVTDRALAEVALNHAARSGEIASAAVKAKAKALLDDALVAFDRSLQLQPDSAQAHVLKAEALSDEGNMTESIAEYQTVLRMQPGTEAAVMGLATEYWKNRHFDDARPLLAQLLKKNFRDPEVNGMLADIDQREGDNVTAEKLAKIALTGKPELIETRVVLARVYLAENKPRLAVTELLKVARADIDGNYHFLLYRAYQQAGEEAAARQALAEYRRLHGIGNQ